ncbi:hypothetical protein DNX69_06165 [Rhodopseudomonas palustris]|uniref:DUF2946 domain-containing protein n=1 Tax=Rhodopseudomonas palustris TaxID=1076 RepID=A0A323UKE2_RHOPL|nr:hypothetical protein [Rhodopseudomonas palustris]PZA12879.1 hypothetical protein DNX69_06165 [Rhodopseudomonas palustris]
MTIKFARQLVARFALLALTLQLALSFGHTHVHRIVGHSSYMANARMLTSLASQPHRAGLDDDHEQCSICFSNFLLSAASLPDAAGRPQLRDFVAINGPMPPLRRVTFEQRRSPFESRAPPKVG